MEFSNQNITRKRGFMKATGIIRRIDELGRIVIPKEIRKSLRIKEGENLEIYVDKEKNIILKKHSLIKKLNDFAQDFADSIHAFIKHDVIITDNDTILAVSGSLKKECLNQSISSDLESKINKREEILERHKKTISIIDNKNIEATYAVSPVIVNGDTIGLVMILSTNDIVDDIDFKIAQIASKFLNSHLEQ